MNRAFGASKNGECWGLRVDYMRAWHKRRNWTHRTICYDRSVWYE